MIPPRSTGRVEAPGLLVILPDGAEGRTFSGRGSRSPPPPGAWEDQISGRPRSPSTVLQTAPPRSVVAGPGSPPDPSRTTPDPASRPAPPPRRSPRRGQGHLIGVELTTELPSEAPQEVLTPARRPTVARLPSLSTPIPGGLPWIRPSCSRRSTWGWCPPPRRSRPRTAAPGPDAPAQGAPDASSTEARGIPSPLSRSWPLVGLGREGRALSPNRELEIDRGSARWGLESPGSIRTPAGFRQGAGVSHPWKVHGPGAEPGVRPLFSYLSGVLLSR